MKENGNYAWIAIPGTDEEVYSPALSKRDFLVYSKDLSGNLLHLARKSGFRLKTSEGDEDTSTRVTNNHGEGQCPDVPDALKAAAQKRSQRRAQIQSKLYHPGFDGVTPPRPISTSVPDADQSPAPTGTQFHREPNPTQPKKQGTVVVSALLGTDGHLAQVKVVRSLTPQLDTKALEAVKSWNFEPARKNGMPVPVLMNVEVNFRLD